MTNIKPSKQELNLILLGLILLFIAWLLLLVEPIIHSQPYNSTALVNTTVNITNSAPMVYNVYLDNPINLIAYDNKTVYCNATIFDFDNQTISVNATLYIVGITDENSVDDGNDHYTNTSCSRASPQDREMQYRCTFSVRYYANNNTNWRCNVTAKDTGNAVNSNISNLATINPLVAIKLPSLIDYGDLAVWDISPDIDANVTNAGNRDVNISVEGWGSTPGDGLAFVCDYGSIPISYERYNTTQGIGNYNDMYQLSTITTMIPNFYVPQRTSELLDSFNPTWWKVQIPIGAGGICNGTILFTATDRGN
ncbi:MAG: hypothetical protein QW757_04670 [Candidatus Woesearchaeota archaeon]